MTAGLTTFSQRDLSRLREYRSRPELDQEIKEYLEEVITFEKKIAIQDIPNRFKYLESKVTAYLGI